MPSIPSSTPYAGNIRPVSSRVRRGSPTAPNRVSIPRRAHETFAALRLHLDTWRWEGVPILLRSGKRLAAKAHEVAFRFKEPPTRLFRHTPLEHPDPNWLVFRMSPTECTELVMRTKQPGLDLEARESILRAEYTTKDDREASAYEQLLLDVLNGDHTRSYGSTRSSGRGASSTRCSKPGRPVPPRTMSPAATVRPVSIVSSEPVTRGVP